MAGAGFKTALKRAAWALMATVLAALAVIPAAGAGSGDELKKAPCDKRVEYITAWAKTSDPSAWTMLGEMYESGECLPVDKTKAVEYFDRAAEEGHSFAYPLLGYMYVNGLGVERDADEARYWFKKYVLFNIVVDQKKRREWAIHALGGRKVPPLLDEELQWVEDVLAADPREQVKIAIKLRDGDGLPLDREAASTLLKKAGSKENPAAYYELGRGLLARDYKLGRSFRHQEVRWALSKLSQAARVRHAPAEKMLGLIYADPEGYRHLPEWGYVLLLRAKEDGAEGVDAALARLEATLSERDKEYRRKQAGEKGLHIP